MSNTIVDLLRERAERVGSVRAYRFLRDGESAEDIRTWEQMDQRARAIATTLRGMGATGTNVLMLYPPGIDFIEGYFGCLYAGAIPVPAYPPEPTRLPRTLPRVQAIVADAKARFALTTKPLLALADFVFAQAPDLRQLQWLASDGVESSAGDTWARPAISADTLAMMQYTSGSTGTPKGVMLTHANLLANAECVFQSFEFKPDDRIITWLPTFHDMGFMSGVLQPLYSGCPVTGLPPTAFLEKPYRWLAAIHEWRATVSGAPNFAYDLCVRKTTPEQRAALDLSCWKLAYNGAETLRRDTLERFAEAFSVSKFSPRTMFPCYGLAEATLIVSGSDRNALPISIDVDKAALEHGQVRELPAGTGHTLVASGGIVPGQIVAIVDPESLTRVAPDRVGEIWVAGGSVGLGYWQRAEETASTFGGRLLDAPDLAFVRTGDLGFMHGGQLYICGRAKDVIIVRGANHYPQDIELSVERVSPAIRPGCIAAFAVDVAGEERVVVVAEIDRRYHDRDRRRGERVQPDRRSGETPRRESPAPGEPGPFDADQLFDLVREAIASRHELGPHAIVLIRAGSIHKTSSGKLQRRACKLAFLSGELEVLADWRSDGTKQLSDVPSAPPRAKRESSQPIDLRSASASLRAPAEPGLAAVPVPVAVPAAPVQPPLTIGVAALRMPAVIVALADTAQRDALVATLADQRAAVTGAIPGDALVDQARTSTIAVVVSDDLALLGRLADASPLTARVLMTAFEDPTAVRDAVAAGRVTSVLTHTAGTLQVQSAVGETLDAWLAQHTDAAISGIESWIADWLAKRLDVNAKTIDRDSTLTAYGLDSLAIVEVLTALSEWLGDPVPDTAVRGRASIRSVARRLASTDLGTRTRRSAEAVTDAAIAIVGMGCAVPGARGADALWQLVRSGGDAIGEVPLDRLHPPSTATRPGGMLEHGITDFDAAFFGLAPRDAANIDPQQRLLLETAWEALEDAGINPNELAGSDTGVFVGISGNDFLRAHPMLAITDSPSAAAQRLSYFFNFKGPSFAVDAGEASSISALHLAVASLQRGECSVALVGGTQLVLAGDLHTAYSKARLLSSEGRCKPLDVTADGTVLSDGCGVIVLKRVDDARSAGHRVRAQILGTALRQNGRGHGITAPNEAAQDQVIRDALRRANVNPHDVGYVELNGRGVAAYDAIEVRALTSALAAERPLGQVCAVGSLKANLGEMRAAAGTLAVIKAALVLEHAELPPLRGFTAPHPDVVLGESFVAPTTARPWATDGVRRVACVNQFGLLGTNGVVVLAREAAPAPARDPIIGAELLCLSARSEDALRAVAARYLEMLAAPDAPTLADLCFTANRGRAHFAQRAALTAMSPAEMTDRLGALARGEVRGQRASGRGSARVAFVVGGAGGAAGRGRELYTSDARFRTVIQRADAVVRSVLSRSLLTSLYEGAAWDPALDGPATVALELALAEVWQSWGVYPDVVTGHGPGEYAAAAIAGALGLEDAITLACTPAGRLEAVASRMTLRAPVIPLVASISAKRHAAVLDTAYWVRQAAESPQLDRVKRELVREGADAFVEILPGEGSDPARMLAALGALYERGITPNWIGLYHGQSRRQVSVPLYPFERKRCWPDG